jgi:DNA helicase HerA-like ATPase
VGKEPSSQTTSPAQALVESRTRIHRNLLKEARAIAGAISFSLGSAALLRHVLLLGATGSGKSNHAFEIVLDALKHDSVKSCVVIDVKREYRRLPVKESKIRVWSLGGKPFFSFNPLQPPSGDRQHWDRAFVDVFTRAYGLSEPSRRILLDCLGELESDPRDSPTLRELEFQVARFKAGSSREENSRRSLESRLHIINSGPIGDSLSTEKELDFGSLDYGVTVFEIGDVDSLKDQRFLAELILAYLWFHDKVDDNDELVVRRLVVVEEAHRYLSEERPPDQKGERTLLELAIAEARRYGWGFLIIDQMPVLLSRYVWDNVGTVFFHRLTNRDSLERAWKVLVEDPLMKSQSLNQETMSTLLLSLPEDMAVYRRYGSDGIPGPSLPVGIILVPRIGQSDRRE